MKKTLFFVCVLIVTILFLAVGYHGQAKAQDETAAPPSTISEDMQYEASPLNKLGRGALNIASCIAEVPFEVAKVSREKDPFVGCTLGLVQGVFNTFLRGFTGMLDVLTFAIPPYNRPLMEPEYVFKSADELTKEKLW